jgi:hypothetical protein
LGLGTDAQVNNTEPFEFGLGFGLEDKISVKNVLKIDSTIFGQIDVVESLNFIDYWSETAVNFGVL